jgi:addiction module RelE/StbE family toxin
VNLKWHPLALSDRKNIYDYIDADSPSAAILVDDRIWNSITNLKRLPEIGRPGRIAGTRELVIQRTPYIVAYRIQGDTVEILRIFHGARRWPSTMPT